MTDNVIPFPVDANGEADPKALAELDDRLRELAESNERKRQEMASYNVGVSDASLIMSKLNLLAQTVLEPHAVREWELEFAEGVQESFDEMLSQINQVRLLQGVSPAADIQRQVQQQLNLDGR